MLCNVAAGASAVAVAVVDQRTNRVDWVLMLTSLPLVPEGGCGE